jgi:hypothetical protein
MGICHELDMLDMVWRRHHPRLATLAPAALRNWPTTNVFCRSWVCEGIDSMDQKSLVMTTTIGAIHSLIHSWETISNPFNCRLWTRACTLPRRIVITGIIFNLGHNSPSRHIRQSNASRIYNLALLRPGLHTKDTTSRKQPQRRRYQEQPGVAVSAIPSPAKSPSAYDAPALSLTSYTD